jgi:hypothetical protein
MRQDDEAVGGAARSSRPDADAIAEHVPLLGSPSHHHHPLLNFAPPLDFRSSDFFSRRTFLSFNRSSYGAFVRYHILDDTLARGGFRMVPSKHC